MSLSAITGAFSYTGKYIARRLLARGEQVITLTGSPNRPDPFNGQVRAYPFNFDNPAALTASLQGVDTLYNTYWVRFPYGSVTYDSAVENTRRLFRAAKAAGVRRVVHVSITQPSLNSPLPYFHGKAVLEEELRNSGLSYAILRPTVIFGDEDILINNILFLLRRFPLFAIPGDGSYRMQPIFVEDMADLALQAAASSENLTWDLVGPETYTFKELIELAARTLGVRPLLLHTPPRLALWLSQIISLWTGDVTLTQDEVDGLMANLLVSHEAPRGATRLSAWMQTHAHSAGKHYASELKRHYLSS